MRKTCGILCVLTAATFRLSLLSSGAAEDGRSAADPRGRPLSEYTVRSWQTDEGLPHNLVRAITQTPDGYLWVGTRVGLAQFDGIHFTVFDSHNTPALKTRSEER